MEPREIALPLTLDRDGVDDAIAAAGLRLCGVLDRSAQIVALRPDRAAKATFIAGAAGRFERLVVEGPGADALVAALAAHLGAGA
jgi:hypothetical protein